MADADLEEIRKARLQQLRQQQGSSGGGEGGQEDQQRQREADARSSILAQILLPEAADRLGRIRLVKESRAVDVENRLIMLARSGQLRQKVTEEQLKEMLNSLSEQQKEQEKPVVTVRRKGGWDDDDDLDDLLNS
ncbi:hypothetical protein W97_05604 [Coniosporium apollinis CBS 100218]|uniref:Programmed cell death protein 5 n=1 Tax=Coniosporium apollinis (strain CBS 100218) TaxID=1168221 RepID=R7YX31_CONA1|nr:uncharacterized protein W97_05604 [Coniosporium apollinis CBS 100218]EON66211.1 hypothetical protein W97_05604 [Coniosporium apollinis CBS 100218]